MKCSYEPRGQESTNMFPCNIIWVPIHQPKKVSLLKKQSGVRCWPSIEDRIQRRKTKETYPSQLGIWLTLKIWALLSARSLSLHTCRTIIYVLIKFYTKQNWKWSQLNQYPHRTPTTKASINGSKKKIYIFYWINLEWEDFILNMNHTECSAKS